jgi:hypothetical protein
MCGFVQWGVRIHVTQGDSGDGIYAYYRNNSKYEVVGITSYGE